MKSYSLILIAITVASALILGGCEQDAGNVAQTTLSSIPKPTPENTAAVVNGQPVSRAAVNVLTDELAETQGGQNVPEDKIMDQVISRELLRQEAEKLNLAKAPENAARIEHYQRMLFSQIAAESFIKNAKVSDEDMKKEYNQRISEMKLIEYKARHILVDTEAAAKDVLQRLQKGEKFEDLAKQFSKDPGSKDKGGDLGWFDAQRMVAPFSKAVTELKNGETTSAPVQTQFGWHIIRREDSRDQPPPPFDEVKEQISNKLQMDKLQQHIDEMKKTAKIERMAPPAKPAKKEEAPAPSAAAPATTPGSETKPPETTSEAGKPEPATGKPDKSTGQPEPEAGKPESEGKPEPEKAPAN